MSLGRFLTSSIVFFAVVRGTVSRLSATAPLAANDQGVSMPRSYARSNSSRITLFTVREHLDTNAASQRVELHKAVLSLEDSTHRAECPLEKLAHGIGYTPQRSHHSQRVRRACAYPSLLTTYALGCGARTPPSLNLFYSWFAKGRR
ncbi:hypothetical protein C8Q77DRAFT_475598 [Trametes polyzona]|nr:hypothetical protein C8Q77DRAFT_475598 [Trametes polyzona]